MANEIDPRTEKEILDALGVGRVKRLFRRPGPVMTNDALLDRLGRVYCGSDTEQLVGVRNTLTTEGLPTGRTHYRLEPIVGIGSGNVRYQLCPYD